MLEIIEETLIDSLKILPFLFLTYLLMEYLERKTSEKTKDVVKKSGRIGPLIGSILGCFPQCGFSVSASNLYAGRVITLGTLIAIFLSTSDEMLPIAISSGAGISVILKIIGIKVLISIIAGFIIDYILRHKTKIEDEKIHDICDQEHCHCEEYGIFRSTLKHTINIFIFIVVISFVLNLVVSLIGEENLSKILMQNTLFRTNYCKCNWINTELCCICYSNGTLFKQHYNLRFCYCRIINWCRSGTCSII